MHRGQRWVLWKDRMGGILKGSTTGLGKGHGHGTLAQNTAIPYSEAFTQIL